MPELPEVETVTNSVKKHLLNNTFSDLIINWPKVLDNFDINNFQNKVSGKRY